MSTARLILLFVFMSVILTIVVVSAMSMLFNGKITCDYLITGIITASFVSFIVGGIFVMFVKKLQDIQKGLNEEISERRRYEEERLKIRNLESIVRLTAGIAHEINNPLTTASLNMQVLKGKLKSGFDEKDFLQKLNVTERNIGRASMIAKELMEFSRQRECRLTALNINKVIAGTAALISHGLKNIKIHQNLTDIPDISGDAGKLEQVFINILNNAVEAMPAGGDIVISTSSSGGYAEVAISDTGIGIPEEHLSRVFTPFFTTKEVGSGAGLGLSICYGIIEQHNGEINISSAAGKGTSVNIKLPMRKT